jgi:type I restriction enzyme, S subunit
MGTGPPDDWRTVKLADLGEVNRGRSRHRPRYADHLYGGPYPFIQTGDVKASGGLITHYGQTYSEAGLGQSRLWPAGTMCITIAANIAETGILSFPACFPDSVVGFIPDESECDVRFVQYMFQHMKARLQHEASGSVQDNINLGTLDRLRFSVPSLSEQRSITSVLGGLDDKIELNRRMNETLEAMARALFKSWFVDFDPVKAHLGNSEALGPEPEVARLFPGDFENSHLGSVPRGWNAADVGSVVQERNERVGRLEAVVLSAVSSGKLVRSDKQFSKRVYSTDIAKYKVVEQYDYAYNPSRINIGSIGMQEDRPRGAVSPVYVVLRPNHPYQYWLGFFLQLPRAFAIIGQLCSGSVRQSLTYRDFRSIPAVIPPESVVRAFNSEYSNFKDLQLSLYRESRLLSELRDLLLPRLLSGELEVSEPTSSSIAAVRPVRTSGLAEVVDNVR